MGREVCRAVIDAEDLDLVAAVDPKLAGIDLRQVVGGDVPALQILAEVDSLEGMGVDVAVEFSIADAARPHLGWFAAHGVHLVEGTTGLTEEDLARMEAAFDASNANAVIAANFAIGAVLLMRLCELAAPLMPDVEIIELHHDAKRDSPSGTALHTAQKIAAARAAAGTPAGTPDPTVLQTIPGARGANGPGGVHLHSVRLPGLIAHEEVIFGAVGQSLTIRHDSYDRSSFMAGVLLAVREVQKRRGVTVGLEPLLGF
jgi:4-hydroxy-tetrahydrodipicolinate reductase